MVHFKLPHQKIVQFFMCALVITLVHQAGRSAANIERTCSFNSRPHRQGLCGPQLMTMMDFLCRALRSVYTSKHRVRRSPEKDMMDSRLKAITLNPKEALSYLTKRDMTGTIVCECCYHPCSQGELLQYCELPVYSMKKRDISTSLSSLQGSTVEDSLSPGYY